MPIGTKGTKRTKPQEALWKKVLRHDGEYYVFSPYELIWDGDRYYILGWSDKYNDLRTFRVDRIWDIPEVLKEKAVRRKTE